MCPLPPLREPRPSGVNQGVSGRHFLKHEHLNAPLRLTECVPLRCLPAIHFRLASTVREWLGFPRTRAPRHPVETDRVSPPAAALRFASVWRQQGVRCLRILEPVHPNAPGCPVETDRLCPPAPWPASVLNQQNRVVSGLAPQTRAPQRPVKTDCVSTRCHIAIRFRLATTERVWLAFSRTRAPHRPVATLRVCYFWHYFWQGLVRIHQGTATLSNCNIYGNMDLSYVSALPASLRPCTPDSLTL